ncbi:endonuclease/exonuclease/phosphatase family protein [Tamlana sp. 62-3]|uniref:Endonuclease/exonuclease/phosphatase family protein n=1 Tax=Neotamlana sargassicola TaxID=2883125 RepID=A0A9X1I562_9FLAO|nr:endonuclease/exonuclease/phosphatase family protein [Tamlana sargassicola]MCB4808065.1 endonuclease/exonuclease/phosphatase family protein [Tamlana sargassicola]
MPSFAKPKFSFPFILNDEINHLKAHKTLREIPDKVDDKLLIASWNIANLGLQDRHTDHYKLIAEIINWFDVVAVQEVNANLEGLRNIESELPSYYSLIFSDRGGNNERSAFIYDNRKIKLLELVGEIAVAPKDHKYIKIKGITETFTGFDRNPYLCSFQWQNFTFILITVHSFSGSTSKSDLNRRALEAYAISRYADLNRKNKNAFSKNIIALGDFNIPKVEPGDVVYNALLSRGLLLPYHSTKVYSNISNDKQFDQIAFLPDIKSKIVNNGVFDFDTAIFPELWQNETPKNFRSYLRYYISDHRPLWMQLDL